MAGKTFKQQAAALAKEGRLDEPRKKWMKWSDQGPLETELTLACLEGRAKDALVLLELGANPNALNEHGRSPLRGCYAGLGEGSWAWPAAKEVLGALARAGADLDHRDNNGESVAMLAAYSSNCLDLLEWLLANGAAGPDRAGERALEWTLLHWAARTGNLAGAKLLVERGEDAAAIAEVSLVMGISMGLKKTALLTPAGLCRLWEPRHANSEASEYLEAAELAAKERMALGGKNAVSENQTHAVSRRKSL